MGSVLQLPYNSKRWHYKHHSQPLSQSVSHWKSAIKNDRRDGQQAAQFVKYDQTTPPKTLLCVPCTCLLPWQCSPRLKYEPVPPSLLLFYPPPTPLQGLTSLFIQLDDSLTLLSLPSFLWSASHSLPLTLPAKWNLANCFLLLIPWLCSNKTHTQCKLASEDTETNYMLSMQTHVKLFICVHLPTRSDTRVAILN